jgi:hypothetical protein
MDYADDLEIIEYWKLFYKFFEIKEKEIELKAKKFVKLVRENGKDQLTFAELQQYLVIYMENITKAVKNAEQLCKILELEVCV